jgi:hypothetical protein
VVSWVAGLGFRWPYGFAIEQCPGGHKPDEPAESSGTDCKASECALAAMLAPHKRCAGTCLNPKPQAFVLACAAGTKPGGVAAEGPVKSEAAKEEGEGDSFEDQVRHECRLARARAHTDGWISDCTQSCQWGRRPH